MREHLVEGDRGDRQGQHDPEQSAELRDVVGMAAMHVMAAHPWHAGHVVVVHVVIGHVVAVHLVVVIAVGLVVVRARHAGHLHPGHVVVVHVVVVLVGLRVHAMHLLLMALPRFVTRHAATLCRDGRQ